MTLTLKDWLRRERQPEYCGINARSHLRTLGAAKTGRGIHYRINLNAFASAANRLCDAIAKARGEG